MRKNVVYNITFILIIYFSFFLLSCDKNEDKKNIEITIENIELSKTSMSLFIGESETLKAKIIPDNVNYKTILWKSNDNSIAEVDDYGKVTAIRTGKTQILAMSEDHSIITMCVVNVSQKSIPISDISLSDSVIVLTQNESINITANIIPANADNQIVTWKSTNNSIAAIKDGKVNAFKRGTVLITATSDNNKSATCIVTVLGKFTDHRDGNVYLETNIGDQVWMAENLRYLPKVSNDVSYFVPCYYVYGYTGTDLITAKDNENYKTYGALYNWAAATNNEVINDNNNKIKGICPEGWHLPSDVEWQELMTFLGEDEKAVIKLKAVGTAKDGTGLWNDTNIKATNESGFSAIPGGAFNRSRVYTGIGSTGFWWSSTPHETYTSWCHSLGFYSHSSFNWGYDMINCGFSVRCLRD